MFSTTLTADQPLDEDFALSAVDLELQYELIEREGNGIGLAFTGGSGLPRAAAKPMRSSLARSSSWPAASFF
jgi:hypothetical protein